MRYSVKGIAIAAVQSLLVAGTVTTMVVVAPVASAVPADQVTIVRGAPTDDRGGSTANPNALFELKSPAWPGRNECRLDGAAWTACSFYFEANGLAAGSHRFEVRQYNQDGVQTLDSWQWNVLANPAIDVEPHTYCWAGFDDYRLLSGGIQQPFRHGVALYRSYVPGSSSAAAWPNQNAVYYATWQGRTILNPLTGGDIPNPAYQTKPPADTPPIESPDDTQLATAETYATRNAAWLNMFTGDVLDGFDQNGVPTPTPVTIGWPQKDANVYAAGDGAPFGMAADVSLDRTDPNSAGMQPKWDVWSPGASDGAYAAKVAATVNEKTTPCLLVVPPVAVLDNGNGTLSATFGWLNLSPWTITAADGTAWQLPDAAGNARMSGNHVTGLDGLSTVPSGMPTTFGANSSGTWTYTFPNPGGNVSTPVTWTVGREAASLYVRTTSLLPLPPNPGPIPTGVVVPASSVPAGQNPFTHVDVNTPQDNPARPIAVAAADPAQDPTDYVTAPVPSVGTSGGAVGASATLTLKSTIKKPKNGYVKPGKKIHFKATIRNTGTVDVVNPRLCERIPKGLTFVSAPGRELINGHRVCWTTSRMAAGTAVHGRMTLKATKNAKIGKRVNRLTLNAVNAPVTTSTKQFHVGTKKQNTP